MNRAVAGDDAAFTALVERHRRELHGHCRRLLTSSDRAEDALQEALLRAWRARSHFAGRATFRTWLYRIATNACMDEMRRDRRQTRPPASAQGPDASDVADQPREPASTDPGPDALLETGEAVERPAARHRAAAAEAARRPDPLRGAALLLGRGGTSCWARPSPR